MKNTERHNETIPDAMASEPLTETLRQLSDSVDALLKETEDALSKERQACSASLLSRMSLPGLLIAGNKVVEHMLAVAAEIEERDPFLADDYRYTVYRKLERILYYEDEQAAE